MNRALQWKLIAGFILVFIAGGISGAFLGGLYAQQHFLEFHRPELIGARMKERLRSELNLTPEQVAKISPIIDKTAVAILPGQVRTAVPFQKKFVRAQYLRPGRGKDRAARTYRSRHRIVD